MDYAGRIARFQTLLDTVADVAFLPIATDLEYLMGVPRDIPNFGVTLHPGGWLEGAWLTAAHDPILALPRMTAEFGGLDKLSNVELRVLGDWDDPVMMVKNIIDSFGLPGKIRIALSDRAHAETAIHLGEMYPEATFISATDLMRRLRTVKDADEIALMRRAGEVTEAAFADVIDQLKFGMTELDVVSEVDYQLRRHGSLGPSFTTSLYNSGPDHPMMFGDRLNTWKRILTPPVSILFDFGAVFEGICYDYGRTVSFGEPPADFVRVYETVMTAQRAGIAALRVGNTCESADAAARQVVIDAGYGDFFRHRLGHSIGWDVHEPPFLTRGDTTVFQEGMMFTVEPSITQMNTFSSRVEDVVVVRPDAGEPLTYGYQSLIVIDG